MVSSYLWADTNSRLGEISILIPEKAFAGLLVMTVADLLQLTQARNKLIFSQFFDKDSMKHLLGLQLWRLFKYAELAKIVWQNEKVFFNLLSKVRAGNIDDDVEKLLKARFIHESGEKLSKRCLAHITENEPVMKSNDASYLGSSTQ